MAVRKLRTRTLQQKRRLVKMMVLRGRGWTYRKIGKRFRITTQAVQRLLAPLGIHPSER